MATADVIPIKPFMVTLTQRSVLELAHQIRWAYYSNHGKKPNFVIVGGNYLTRLKEELRLSSQHRLNGTTLIEGMVLVQVKKEMIEVGE